MSTGSGSAIASGPPGAVVRMLGRYAIEGALGEGGMGLVYRARDTVLDRRVALKILRAEGGEAEATRRLLREARAAAALNHPNAVAIFDVGEDGGTAFIALELVDGHSLRRYVGGREPGLPVRLRWLVDVAAALAAAHREGIVHRDIKPENVMIRSDGQVKVLDFGIARRIAAAPEPDAASAPAPNEAAAAITMDGAVAGTPAYMAPEQLLGDALDGRADQFAWGMLAYELIAGRAPWTSEGGTLNLVRRFSSAPEPITTWCPEVPEPVAAAIMRTLARARDDRFASMDDVIAAVDPFAGSTPRGARESLARVSLVPASEQPTLAALPDRRSSRSATHASSELASAPTMPALPLPPSATHDPSTSTPAATLPSARAPRRPVLAAVTIAIAAVIAVLAFTRRAAVLPASIPTASAGPPATASAGPVPTAITGIAVPAALPEAIAAYRAGLTAMRFGGRTDDLVRAATLDPTLAAAHLMIAIDATESRISDEARQHFHEAEKLRDALGERDRALLDAMAPAVMAQPSNWAEASRRLSALIVRFPGDAQVWYEKGWVAMNAESPDAANVYLERAIALDPSYASAMDAYAQNLAYVGRFSDARRVLDQCIPAAPSFMTCRNTLRLILSQEGACVELEALARQLIASTTAKDSGYRALADALASRGRSMATVREALRQRSAATPAADRHEIELVDTIAAHALAGDFNAAEQAARELDRLVEASRLEATHGRASRWLAQILAETGRVADAGRVAERYLDRRDAWEPDPRAEDFAMAEDATPLLLAFARNAGRITAAAFTARRAEWARVWETKAPPDTVRYVWMHGFAATAWTPDEARDALAALPKYEPIPTFRPQTLGEAAIGRTFLLAGRVDEAITWLDRAARSCRALDFPFEHTRAHLWLGQARESRGDHAGACAAYRVVLDRWGQAKPKSVTADTARERAKALRCEG